MGASAGSSLTTGGRNVAIGYTALYSEDTTGRVVAIGYQALENQNAAGNTYNIAIGYRAGRDIVGGVQNTLMGNDSGGSLTSGGNNVAMGYRAATAVQTTSNNVAIGSDALLKATGTGNVGVGKQAGAEIVGGDYNVSLGYQAGNNITTGSGNVVIGNADVSSATGDDQLSISDGEDGSVVWITGDSSGNISNGSTAINIAGKQTIWVPANAMTPTASNGCAAVATVETTSGRPDLYVLDFDDGSDEHAQFTVAFPKSWNLGTITFQVFWTSTATDTDGVSWGLQGVGMADNETQDVAYGTAIVVDDACQSAAEELYVTAESSAVTIAGTPADDDLTYFRIFRDVSDANDTAAEDARLIGVKIFYTTDAANDA